MTLLTEVAYGLAEAEPREEVGAAVDRKSGGEAKPEATPVSGLALESTPQTRWDASGQSPRHTPATGLPLDRADTAPDSPERIYLAEIGKVPLLSAEEELELAVAVRRGEEAERKLKALGEADPELRQRLEAEVERGKAAQRRLVESNLRLVVYVARKYLNQGVPFLDLIQEGNLGLLRAIGKYDPARGIRFSTYATWWIRQAVSRAVAEQGSLIRLPVHVTEMARKANWVRQRFWQERGRRPSVEELGAELGVPAEKVQVLLEADLEPLSLEEPVGDESGASLGDFVEDPTADNPTEVLDRRLLREQVARLLATLPDRERQVLELRFGIGDDRTRTLEEVAREVGVTRERVRQIEQKALRRLRQPCRSKALIDYVA